MARYGIYLDSAKEQRTKLMPGDFIVLYKKSRTMQFARGLERLLFGTDKKNLDDKNFFSSMSSVDFMQIVMMVASIIEADFRLYRDDDQVVIYQFF